MHVSDLVVGGTFHPLPHEKPFLQNLEKHGCVAREVACTKKSKSKRGAMWPYAFLFFKMPAHHPSHLLCTLPALKTTFPLSPPPPHHHVNTSLSLSLTSLSHPFSPTHIHTAKDAHNIYLKEQLLIGAIQNLLSAPIPRTLTIFKQPAALHPPSRFHHLHIH